MAKKQTFKKTYAKKIRKYSKKNKQTKKAKGRNTLKRVTFRDPNHPHEITMYMTKQEEKEFRKQYKAEIKQYKKTAKANKVDANKKDTKVNRFFNFFRRKKKVTPVFKKKSESSNKKSSSFDFIKQPVRQDLSPDLPPNPYYRKYYPPIPALSVDYRKYYFDVKTGKDHLK